MDYLHIGTAMSGQLYADLLLMLQESIKDERQGKLHQLLRRYDNTPVHIHQLTMHTVGDHGFKLRSRPPYFMDLVPSDYFPFSKLEKEFRGKSCVNDSELTLADEQFCRECCSAVYHMGRNAQPRR